MARDVLGAGFVIQRVAHEGAGFVRLPGFAGFLHVRIQGLQAFDYAVIKTATHAEGIAHPADQPADFVVQSPLHHRAFGDFLKAKGALGGAEGCAVDVGVFVAQPVVPGGGLYDGFITGWAGTAPAHTRPGAQGGQEGNSLTIDLPVRIAIDVADNFPHGIRAGGNEYTMIDYCHKVHYKRFWDGVQNVIH